MTEWFLSLSTIVKHTSISCLIRHFKSSFVKMPWVTLRYQNQKRSDFAKLVLEYRRINSSITIQVVHNKTKSGIICLGRNQHHEERILSNYQFLMNGTEEKNRDQTIDKTVAKPRKWSETKKLRQGIIG